LRKLLQSFGYVIEEAQGFVPLQYAIPAKCGEQSLREGFGPISDFVQNVFEKVQLVESSGARRLRQDYATACYDARLNGYRPFSGGSSELLDKSGLNGRIVSLDNEIRGTKRSRA
jgi:hypothetical protein